MSDSNPARELTFWEHVNDLRTHLLIGGTVFIIFTVGFVSLGAWIPEYILQPLHGQPLVFLSPMGPLLFQMKIALFGALILSLPIWLILLAHFVGTALTKRHRPPFYLLVFSSLVFGISSVAISYKLIVPLSLTALSKFIISGTSLMLTADSYLSFFLLTTIVVFVILELPVIIVALSLLNLISPHYIARKRRIYIIGLIIILAILTPSTDVITLVIMAVPAIILSEIGIIVAKLVYKQGDNN